MCAQGEVLPKPGDRAVVPTGILMVCLSVLMVGRLTGSPGTVGFKDHPGPGDTDHFLLRAGHGLAQQPAPVTAAGWPTVVGHRVCQTAQGPCRGGLGVAGGLRPWAPQGGPGRRGCPARQREA